MLAVSLPSEITSSAFLRFWPCCASGIASATASYIAVPPFGDHPAERARQQLRDRVVQPCSSIGTLLKR